MINVLLLNISNINILTVQLFSTKENLLKCKKDRTLVELNIEGGSKFISYLVTVLLFGRNHNHHETPLILLSYHSSSQIFDCFLVVLVL